MNDHPASTMTRAERITIRGHASGTITGTLHLPARTDSRAVVPIHPTTAVPERIYLRFADFLSTRGFAAVTYDYRGTGASGNPRAFKDLRMRDWMDEDVPAVATWARDRFPELPHVAVGHSIGGHALRIGHLGFFRPEVRDTLWVEAAQWLEDRAASGDANLARAGNPVRIGTSKDVGDPADGKEGARS